MPKTTLNGKPVYKVLQELKDRNAEIDVTTLSINQKQFNIIKVHFSCYKNKQDVREGGTLLFAQKYLFESENDGYWCMCMDSARNAKIHKCTYRTSGSLCTELRKKYQLIPIPVEIVI